MPIVLLVLALIPAIALLIFIYFKDKKDKEPLGLLIALFFLGIASIIPAIIWELIGEAILNNVFYYETAFKAILNAFLIVGPAEEISKYFFLRITTWKNKNFDYLFDGIVYAVFVSLGFAALENVGYVFEGGIGTALMRMVTSVPGHMSFAVFMGFFYSKAKHADVKGEKGKRNLYNLLSIVVPILWHGLYDAILFVGDAEGNTAATMVLWIIVVIVLFVCTFTLVHKSSKNDYYIAILEDKTQVVYRPSLLGSWNCGCGRTNNGNFCPDCGSKRPMVQTWFCTSCGTKSQWNFCGNCGAPKPFLRPEPTATVTPSVTPIITSSDYK